MRILLVGGSKSGKSLLAQRLTRALAAGGPMYYWATMEPTDGEDRARIARHLRERDGWGFETVECGRSLLRALPEEPGAVLLDSVTALLANEMFGAEFDEAAPQRVLAELLSLSEAVPHFVCVADDLFREAGDLGAWTERYRRGLAQVLRGLAAEFEAVAEVTAGLPRWRKGSL